MVLDFLNDIYMYALIPIGLVALFMGFDRAFRKYEDESRFLRLLGGITGIVTLVLIVAVAINEFSSEDEIITKYTMLFGILLGMSLIARPFKQLPLAFILTVFVLLGLLYFYIANQDKLLAIGGIPMRVIIIIIVVVVLIIFIISFVQEQAMDALLFVLGWGPVIIILGLALLLQGITLILNWPNSDGVLGYLPG